MELEALNDAHTRFQDAGARLVMISPQLVAHNRKIKDAKGLTMSILSDPANDVAHDYGIRHTLPEDLREIYLTFGLDVPSYNGDESWTLPMPARYIIDTGGIVRYAAVNADYTVRPDPEETLAALAALS